MNYVEIKKEKASSPLQAWLSHIGYENKEYKERKFKENEILNEVEKKIRNCHKIFVIADYDNDGIYGGTILVKGLKHLGYEVTYAIPDRVKDGYGMNNRLVDKCIDSGCDLLMTVDNGIACRQSVEYALAKGIQVIVTDHHDIPEDEEKNVLEIPGVPVVHPSTMFSQEEFRSISGATVAYKLMEYLFDVFDKRDRDELDFYRALASVTIISDVMPLIHENRTIFKEGISYIKERKNQCLDYFITNLPNVDLDYIDETMLGFYVCPVINAIGRLDNAEIGIDYFFAEEKDWPHYVAMFIATNEKRKELQNEYIKMVDKKITSENTPGILYFDEEGAIHEGLVGILAGRICNNYGKPAIVFSKAKTGEGEEIWKGSARSIDEVSIIKVLNRIHEKAPDIFAAFGGHAGAAGLSIYSNKKEKFSNFFREAVKNEFDSEMTRYYIRLESPDEISSLIQEMKKYKPWGQGMPKPVVCIDYSVKCLKAYFGSQRAMVNNDMFDVWVDFEKFLNQARDRNYKCVYSNFEKLLANGDENPEARKTEFYCPRRKEDEIRLKLFGEFSTSFSYGKEKIKFDILKMEN